jgi:hypothetical protein
MTCQTYAIMTHINTQHHSISCRNLVIMLDKLINRFVSNHQCVQRHNTFAQRYLVSVIAPTWPVAASYRAVCVDAQRICGVRQWQWGLAGMTALTLHQVLVTCAHRLCKPNHCARCQVESDLQCLAMDRISRLTIEIYFSKQIHFILLTYTTFE